MKKDLFQKILTILILSLLCVSAFWIRFENFQRSPNVTIDEMVYARMGAQMAENPFDYNTLDYGQDLAQGGRDLPDYFFEPLFKHPPLFSALIAISFKIKGSEFKNSIYPALWAGVLSILVIYFLGSILYSRATGLLAALLLWLDPISVVCSQKVWMDPLIAFFVLLAVTCLAYAVKNEKPWFFVWAGLAAGSAMNTKYTGILVIFIGLAYALLYERSLFKIRRFRIGMILPVLMLTPWFLWNGAVYGTDHLFDILRNHLELQTIVQIILQNMFLFTFLLSLLLAAQILLKNFYRPSRPQAPQQSLLKNTGSWLESFSCVLIIIILAGWFKEYILRSLNFFDIPMGTWYQGVFSQEPPKFYIGRLIEFCALYTFGIVSLLTFHQKTPKEEALVRLSAGIILVFFILWGNFQSRYILSAVPFVVLLTSDFLIKALRWMETQPFILRVFEKPLFIVFILYAISKTAMINIHFAFPNDMCYF
ncbi:MAG TPA: glycosyltransferase family 39 protein [Candidatus Omnitrophota bacterium]|jgi:4-amino-4-deoxy-L-arabinose transferase-like glycosyltransferase|nr:glycosyltransferase family 39 protein [Candidatus Omnitrophota bacterium]